MKSILLTLVALVAGASVAQAGDCCDNREQLVLRFSTPHVQAFSAHRLLESSHFDSLVRQKQVARLHDFDRIVVKERVVQPAIKERVVVEKVVNQRESLIDRLRGRSVQKVKQVQRGH